MVDHELTITPGEILLEEFIKPYGLTPTSLAKRLGLPPNRITSIVSGARGISADTAILLAEAFGTSAEVWINIQAHYDLEQARAHPSPDRIERARTLHRELVAA